MNSKPKFCLRNTRLVFQNLICNQNCASRLNRKETFYLFSSNLDQIHQINQNISLRNSSLTAFCAATIGRSYKTFMLSNLLFCQRFQTTDLNKPQVCLHKLFIYWNYYNCNKTIKCRHQYLISFIFIRKFVISKTRIVV